jgi:hypothetical protein
MLKRADRDEWIALEKQEIEDLNNRVMDSFDLNSERDYRKRKRIQSQALRGHFVYEIKHDGRKRARYVADGSRQHPDTYEQTSSYTPSLIAVYLCLFLACCFTQQISLIDVKKAYFYAVIPKGKELYMRPIDGLTGKYAGKWFKLHHQIYGTKSAGYHWQQHLFNFLKDKTGMVQNEIDPCLFERRNSMGRVILRIVVYCDDLLLMGDDDAITAFKKVFMKAFECREYLEVDNYIGLDITYDRTRGILKISQKSYLKKLFNKYSISLQNLTYKDDSPLPPGHLSKSDRDRTDVCPKDIPYLQLIGELNWLLLARPDISAAVNQLAQRVKSYTKTTYHMGIKVLRYLARTADLSIEFRRPDGVNDDFNPYQFIDCHVDASFHDDLEQGTSTTGMIFRLLGAPFYFVTQKHQLVSTSSCQAEYTALYSAAKMAVFINQFLASLGFNDPKPMKIFCDNESAIHIAKHFVLSPKSRHFLLRHHYIRQLVQLKIIDIEFVGTLQQLADPFTKILTAKALKAYIDRLFNRKV